MRNRRRGSVIVPLLVLLAVLAVSVAVVSMRVETTQSSQRAQERRTQAIWLARSALLAGRAGNARVGGVTAHVDVAAGVATASVPGAGVARARRSASGWTEGYDAAP